MIRKIHVDQLRPGIFVHDFNCKMTGENVLINQTLIKTEKAIEIIRSWGIKEVFIDTTRGLDVAHGKTVRKMPGSIDNSLHKVALKQPSVSPKIPLKEEIQLAKNIKKEAVGIIQRALNSVQEGKPLEAGYAYDLIGKMEESVTRNQDALILLTRIKKKDEYTLMHSISVGSLVLAFCKFCKIPHEMTMSLAVGALFHDVGKTKVPLSILNKPGKLSDEEFKIMKRHAEYSAKAMEKAKDLPPEAHDMAMHHHERFDGSGYPNGLKGNEIQFGSQMAAICDVYDAITSARCYKKALDSVKGLKKIYEWSDFHFNKELAFKFIRCIGVYPIGSCVKLENNLIGVVIGSTDNILQPVTRVFYDDRKKAEIPIQDLDLSRMGVNVSCYESSEKWDIDKMNIFPDIAGEANPFS